MGGSFANASKRRLRRYSVSDCEVSRCCGKVSRRSVVPMGDVSASPTTPSSESRISPTKVKCALSRARFLRRLRAIVKARPEMASASSRTSSRIFHILRKVLCTMSHASAYWLPEETSQFVSFGAMVL